MNRFAAIDVGSDAIRCHIVEVAKEGRLDVLERWASARKFGLFEEVFGLGLRLRNVGGAEA